METVLRYIRCVPYTRAKRHAPMIGKVWGYTGWPLPVTVFQFAAMLVSSLGLIFTTPIWAHFGMANVLIFLGAVFGSMFATKQIRIEGRSPWGAALGAGASLAGRPRLDGRRFRSRILTRYRERKMVLVPGPEWKRYRFAIVAVSTPKGRRRRLRRDYWHRSAV